MKAAEFSRVPFAARFSRPQVAQPRPAALARWLFWVTGLVVAMIVVGGITRLTESGLSITRWEPVSGTIPPLSHADWVHQFDLYKHTTQFQTVNQSMTLADFQFIFFWEYIHRLLGRVIGLAYAVPLLWFAWNRAIPQGYGWRLSALLALGAFQGAIGWWMVTSGLVGRVDVSHIRLAVHLLTAFFILGGLCWTAFDLLALHRDKRARPARLSPLALTALIAMTIQMLLGAFTAGLRAGHAFSSWPKMGEEWFPSATPIFTPFWTNFVDNPIIVQFMHRWWAWVATLLLLLLARAALKAGSPASAIGLPLLLVVQIALGIATLLTGVELWVAVAHQGVAGLVVILATAAAHAHGARAPGGFR